MAARGLKHRDKKCMSFNAKIKVAVSVDKQCTLIRIYMEKYISVRR